MSDEPNREAESGSRDRKREPPKPPRRGVFVMTGVVVLVLLILGAVGHWMTASRAAATQQDALDAVPTVQTAIARRVDAPEDITLPGQTEPFDTATIYARATGYIAQRKVDIGSRVHAGDLLVLIAAPDTDAQLAQAQAQLLQYQAALLQAQQSVQSAIATTKLAHVTKYRETTLAAAGWETKQNADNSTANFSVQSNGVLSAEAGVRVAQANIAAQVATVNRLQALVGFERVVAPFDGIITARNVDTGDLVSADQNGGTPLFSIDRTDVLRVAVYVPQSAAIGMRDGLPADISVAEMPEQIFHGRVARSSVSLTASARTMLVEVDVANPDGALRAGLYAEVTFHVPRDHPGVVIPDEAMVFDAAGLHVLIVQPDGTVKARPIKIYRDFGISAELQSGLSGGETLVVNAPAELEDGGKVHTGTPAKAPTS
jgi:RND family efflux transporter MFP subunit